MLRSDQRREAVWALYQADLLGRPLEEVLPSGAHGFTRALTHAVDDHRDELDELIARHARGWTLDRIAPLERAILRVGLLELLYIDDQPADVQLPSAIDLAVAETEPGLRGDTASGGGTKPAVLETGARVQVPLFINIGDVVRVDTRTGEYVSRA